MLPLFYVDELPTQINGSHHLGGGAAHHIARVLRTVPGEELLLSDGQGHWSRTSVLAVDRSSVEVAVLESGFQPSRDISITVIQAITKGDRSRENIELLVEAGVDRIIPWQAQRSIGKLPDGVGKLRSAVIEAGKQSRRFYLPEVSDVVGLEATSAIIIDADVSLILEAGATQKLSDIVSKKLNIRSVVLVVGPEGGITNEELETMTNAGATPVQLGQTIFRSAHAGIAAISALSVALGLW